MIEIFTVSFFYKLTIASIRMTTPILFATIGEIYAERSGLVNLSLEGTMLIGAFTGFIATYYFGNPWVGVFVAALSGILFTSIFAFLTINLAVNQILSGIALNFVAIGITGFFYRILFGISSYPPKIEKFAEYFIPYLSNIPLFGKILFQNTPLVYIGFLLIPFTYFFMYKTRWGLYIRTSGENPKALDTMGINVFSIRYLAILICGALTSIGGCYLSIGSLNMFTEEMVSGRGFIALAAVMVGKWNPFGAFFACLLFGTADAFQLRLQAMGFNVPYQFSLMFPYALTLVVMICVVGRLNAPEAIAKPYIKEGKGI